MFQAMTQGVGHMLASDSALMLLSMSFGILLGMLWSGRAFPRRLPRAILRSEGLTRRGF
jgi:hypothetical protein